MEVVTENNAQEWYFYEGAKLGKLNQAKREWEEAMNDISYWNRYALHPFKGFDIMAEKLRYEAPKYMASLLLPYLKERDRILDIGAGTGLVGQQLAEKMAKIDGIDFSHQMLQKAKLRGYSDLYCADVRQDMREIVLGTYNLIVSVGLYGDFLDVSLLKYVLPLLENKGSVIALAGRYERIGNKAREILENNGFFVVEERKRFAHFTTLRFKIDYIYLIAIKL